MEGKKNIERISTWIIVVLFLVGTVGHVISQFRNFMISLTPITLTITTIILLYNILKERNKEIIYWIVVVILLTLSIEIVGVKTKLIFGDYNYSSVLGYKIFDVPLIIGFNWVLIILGAIQIAEKYLNQKPLIIFISSLLAVIFDFVLEPNAMKLNYWSWKGNSIPPQNYLAWFFIALIASTVYYSFHIKINSSLPKVYFLAQLIFFFLLLILI